MSPDNLIELIKAVKPSSAIFTTYTISIAFIEGVLLPTLRHAGCRDVAILVDANEAATSLEETQSNAVGRKYRLAPVIAPNGGIFHPKLAYLCGADFDLLAIGSGNLTLPGQSKQLECLDIVNSNHHPGVFRDFAAMAEDLASKISGTSKQATDLLRFVGSLAKTASESSKSTIASFPDAPQLIHTVNTPASEQLIQLCQEQNFQVTEITILSPFHAPDGAPIIGLHKQLGASKLHVGLDRPTLVAPFDKKKFKQTIGLDFVVPDIGKDNRHLHAKVFELSDGVSSLVMTGSINATNQSFNSIKNVEVSLARLTPKNCFTWAPATPSSYQPKSFVPTARDAEFAYLEATLGMDGRISGQISEAAALPKNAIASLLQNENGSEYPTLIVQIDPVGHFSFALTFELNSGSSIQLALSAKDFSAQCWLNIEEDLTSTDEERKGKQAIRHIIAGDFGDEDVFELFQILTRATQNATTQRSAARTSSANTGEMTTTVKAEKFSYTQWKNSGLRAPQKGLFGIHGGDTLRAFLRWLNATGHSSDSNDDVRGDSGTKAAKPEFKLVGDAAERSDGFDLQGTLREIIQAIPAVLARNEKLDAAAMLATVAGAYALRLSINSTWQDERAYKPLLSWLDEFSRFEYQEDGHETLIQFALGASSVVFSIAIQNSSHFPAAVLKDNILRFNPQWRLDAPKQEELAAILEKEIFSRVPPAMRGEAMSGLTEIWNAESVDERIEELVNCAKDPSYAPTEDDERAFPNAIAGIRRILQVDAKRRYHGILLNSSGCPHCYQAFGEATRLELRSKHVVACPNSNCRKTIFYLEDKNVKKRVIEAIKNA